MRLQSDEVRCGGFRVLFGPGSGDEPRVRLLPGERLLGAGITAAVVEGLSQAPQLFSSALRVLPPVRPYDRVEVSLVPGDEVQGEALGLGLGCIRLSLGEQAGSFEVSRIARHEALHLLLAAGLPGGEKWDDPELAFGDWIVRGLEASKDARPPRLGRGAAVLDKLPRSRLEMQKRDAQEFGEPLAFELQAASEQHRLWLCEAALGAHYLEAAARLAADAGEAFVAVVLDDWLADYEQYAHGLGNAPSGAGKLWRLSEPGFARDPVVRLAAAAQAAQRDDGSLFVGERHERADEPVVWKSRGRVRLPLFRGEPRARAAPVHALRAAIKGMPEAMQLLEQAVRGVEGFEARALWPRILARFRELPQSEPETLPAVQIIDGEKASETFQAFDEAAKSLKFFFGDGSVWIPDVLPPRPIATLVDTRHAALLLVHGGPMTARELKQARELAALQPVRGALFTDLQRGVAYEQLPDLPEALDPRYREETWTASEPLKDLVKEIDAATAEGRLTTAASHLLAMTAPGLEERHPPRARARAD
ncbi:MAG TPA: hypothetical protein VH083_09515 [Myxococcales bacterium]|nr:hypothetical protein [Myxococcales bacterium]